MKGIIGKRLIKNIVPRDKSYDIRDTRLKGFILRVQPSGYRSFYCEYARGKKYFIGRADTISPDDAREIALQKLQLQANTCLMIGDRPDTDILGAQQLGIQTALVRTGRFAPGEKLPDKMLAPDWDVENLIQLKQSLGL